MIAWAFFSPIPLSDVSSSLVAVLMFTAASAAPANANHNDSTRNNFFMMASSIFGGVAAVYSVRRVTARDYSTDGLLENGLITESEVKSQAGLCNKPADSNNGDGARSIWNSAG